MSQGKLIIICGLPGSGKTTLAKQLEEEQNAIRFCPDEIMELENIELYDEKKRNDIEKLQWIEAQNIIQSGGVAIIEWGTWAKEERDILREGARNLGARVELYCLSETADVLFDRIQKRAMEDPPVTRDQVDAWIKSFQAPREEELFLFDNQ